MKSAIAVITIVHFLLALLLAGTAVIVVMQIRNPEVAKESDAVKGLIVGASVLAVPAIALLVAALGLRKRRRWGWWAALLTDGAVLATLTYSTFSENSIDWEEVAFAILFAVVCIILLLPVVRKSYMGEPAPAVSS
jgi:hypothetical protein